MKQKALKLILSGAASLALAVSLTATTFAYVLIGTNAVVEEFDFKVEGQEGLMISLDGVNFSQDITGEQLKIALAGSEEAFDANYITGTTIKDSGNSIEADGGVNFVKEKLDRSTTPNTRSYVDATANKDYLKFDLYFKVLNTKTAATEYTVAFGENTYINGVEDDVTIQHGFTTWTYDSANDYYTPTTYKAGDTLKQNSANAMRLGIYNEEMTDKLKVYEVTDSADLGSAAITGRTDKAHDPYSSVMINYYNAYHPNAAFKTTNTVKKDADGNALDGVYGAEEGEAFDTTSQYGVKDANGNWTGETVGTFSSNSDIMKVTVLIWLEGWDADYLLGTSVAGSQFACALEFVLNEN